MIKEADREFYLSVSFLFYSPCFFLCVFFMPLFLIQFSSKYSVNKYIKRHIANNTSSISTFLILFILNLLNILFVFICPNTVSTSMEHLLLCLQPSSLMSNSFAVLLLLMKIVILYVRAKPHCP